MNGDQPAPPDDEAPAGAPVSGAPAGGCPDGAQPDAGLPDSACPGPARPSVEVSGSAAPGAGRTDDGLPGDTALDDEAQDDAAQDGAARVVEEAGAGSPVVQALAVFARAAEELAGAVSGSAWALSDPQSREAVRSVVAALGVGEAAFLGLVRNLDARPEAVAGAGAGFAAQTFLTGAVRRSRAQAARDVKAARALDAGPGLPGEDVFADGEVHAPALGAVFAAGGVNREHVDIAVRALGDLPKGLLRRVDPDGVTVGAKADAFLAEQAQVMDPDTLRRVCVQLRAYLDPGGERFDAEAHERRFLSMRVTDDGMVLLRAMIPAADGAAVKAALEAAAAPQPATEALGEAVGEDGQATLVRDGRTKGQRQVDALAGICRHWTGCQQDDARGQAHVMVIADLDQLAAAQAARTAGTDRQTTDPDRGAAFTNPAGQRVGRAHCVQTGPVSPLTLQALACDAILQAVVLDRSGAVLSLGRAVRTVSAAQRRALIARDRGCVIPGCHAPPGICDAHHLRWWRNGGATDLTNLALVCGRHHTDIHAGVWTLEMIDGVPYGIPPRWAHPGQPRLRNTVHHTDTLTRHFTTQLVIDLTEPAQVAPAEPEAPAERAAPRPPDTG